MSIPGLPPIDVPQWERDPHSCKTCKHSYFESSDTDRRYMRCRRSEWQHECRFERHYTGDCGEAGLYWKERAA